MKRGNTILYDAFLLTCASFAMRVVQMAFQVYLSGMIGAAGIGLFQLIMTISVLATTVGASGVRITTTCLVAEELGKGSHGGIKQVVRCCALYAGILSVFVAVLLYTYSELIAGWWIGDLRAVLSLRITAATLPVTCLIFVLEGYFTAAGRVGRYLLLEIAGRIISIAATVVLLKAFTGTGAEYACAAIIGGSAVGRILYFIALYFLYLLDKRKWPVQKSCKPAFFRVISFAFPIALSNYIRSGLSAAENMLIPWGLRRSGDSDEQALASYGIVHGMALPILTLPAALLMSVTEILVPELSECRIRGSRVRIRYLVTQVLKSGLIFSVFAAVLFYCLAEELGLLIYGNLEAARYIRIFSPVVVLMYLEILTDGMNRGLNQNITSMRNDTVVSVLDVVMLFLLLPRYGLYGYLLGFTVNHILSFLVSFVLALRASGSRPDWLLHSKVALAALLSVYFSNNWFHVLVEGISGIPHTIFHGIIIAYVYIFFLILLNAVKTSDIRWIRGLIKPVAKLDLESADKRDERI